MGERSIDWIIEELEDKNGIVFPLGAKDGKILDHLDYLLDNASVESVWAFFNSQKNFDFDALRFLSDELMKPRKISNDDQELISNMIRELKNSSKDLLFGRSSGVFMQIEELALEGFEQLGKRTKVALMFWMYLALIEGSIGDLAQIFYRIARKKGDQEFINSYKKSLQKGQHLMFGQLRHFAIKWKLTKTNKETFLHTTNLRDQIGHANLFYDSKRDKVLLPNREELSFKEFTEEYIRVYDFFKELTFQLNEQSTDIVKSADRYRKAIAKEMQKVIRSGIKKKRWVELKPWKKKQES